MIETADIQDGASLGLLVWGAEALAVAVGTVGVGGLSVLASLRDDLCGWGLVYLLVGALTGPLRRWAPLVWGGLLLLGDPGVVPRWGHGVVVLLAAAAWFALRRAPSRARAALPAAGSVLVALGWLWPAGEGEPAGTPGAGPDVVLIVVDTLRADHVGHAGYSRPTTPHLDRLAAEGLRFTAARSTSSWTLPAHASLFTGLLPSEHGAHAGHPLLTPDVPTLAEALDARGYRTVGLSANAWVSGGTGLDRGFERFTFLGDDGIVSQLLLPLLVRRPVDLGGRALTDHALAALDAAGDEPVFLFVNYLEAHEPLGTVPEPQRSAFGPVDPVVGRAWMRDMPRFWCTCETDRADLSCEDGLYRVEAERADAVVDAYDAGIAYVDGLIGELVDGLERPTLLVVTSDHGEHLGEDGRLGHMVWADDPLLDIPLVVHGPGIEPGVDTAPIDLAELAPWLLARVDQRPPPPRRLAATSEVHPHPESTTQQWGALFGCDFAPARVARRVVLTPDGVERDEGWEAPAADRALDPATREALRGLGYLD